MNAALASGDTSTWRVLGLAGSLRRHSYNRSLLRAAAELAPEDLRVSVYEDLAQVPMFNEDTEDEAFRQGPVRAFCEQVIAADAVLLATPEYNHSVPGVLKNALDWLSRPGARAALVGKPIAVIGATAGKWGTRLAQAAVRQVLLATESQIVGAPLYLANAADAFGADGRLRDDSVRGALGEVLLALRSAIGAPQARRSCL
jgi:chromate reductase